MTAGGRFPNTGPRSKRDRKYSAEAERMHPLDVPGHGDKAPLIADAVEPAQQELAESHHRFDDAEHWLRGLLAQTIELFALRRPQTPGHSFDRCRVFRRRRRRGKPFAPGGMLPNRRSPAPACGSKRASLMAAG